MSVDILAPPSLDNGSDLAADWIAYLSGHLNLVVPVVTAAIVIFTALITICALRRGKNDSMHKGNLSLIFAQIISFFVRLDPIAPARNNDNGRAQLLELFPWLPEWVDYNMLIAGLAMVVIIVVGIAVICVAVSRRNRGPESIRLRGHSSFLPRLLFFVSVFVIFFCVRWARVFIDGWPKITAFTNVCKCIQSHGGSWMELGYKIK